MSARKFQLTFSILAQKDVDNIFAYTLENWGRKQVDIYQARLDKAFRDLCEFPYQGREHNTELRVTVVAHHRIYYRIQNQTIIVIRILHERMDEISHVSR